jgi:hypothetical protein
MNDARNNEMKEKENIQDILDRNPLFPCKLYEIEYIKIIRELINIHPATVYLVFKIATSEVAKEIIKFPIPIYRVKRNWHTALKHFKRLEMVDFKDIEIHSIEPHKAILTPFGRFVVEKWENSPLFKAFEVLDTLNFISTNHYESIFNNNFIAYKDRKGNVFYSETQKIYHKYNLISRTKTKSSIKITVDSGFSDDMYDYYIKENIYNKLVNDDSTIPIKLKESGLAIYIQLNFRNHNFKISVLYNDDFTERYFNVQKSIDLTDIIVERRKSKISFKNLNVTKNNTQKKKKVDVSQSAGSQTSKKQEERTDFEAIQHQQTGKKTQPIQKNKPTTIIIQKTNKTLNQRPEVTFSNNNIIKNRNITTPDEFTEKLSKEQKEMEEIEKKLKEEEKQLKNERYEKKIRDINKENQERFKKIKEFYDKVLREEVNYCLEGRYKKLRSNKVKKRLNQKSSFIFSSYSQDDFIDYIFDFKRYWKGQLPKDLLKYNQFLKRKIENKKISDSFEVSKDISEIKVENIEDINPIKKCSALGRYIIVIRYFLFLTLVVLFINILILGFNGINNAPFPPSSTARSFKYLCLTVYVILSILIAGFLIPILYSISFIEISKKNLRLK